MSRFLYLSSRLRPNGETDTLSCDFYWNVVGECRGLEAGPLILRITLKSLVAPVVERKIFLVYDPQMPRSPAAGILMDMLRQGDEA